MTKIREMITKKKFTEETLGEVVYAFNKRAKNYRDLKRKSRGNSEKIAAEMIEIQYYKRKSFMLNLLCEPKEIHSINGSRYIWAELGNRNFHIQSEEFCEDIKNLKHLPKKTLENFQTKGEAEENLIPEEIANEIYEVIKNLDFEIIYS